MKKNFAVFLLSIFTILFISSCSPSKKFTNENGKDIIEVKLPTIKNEIRVLLAEKNTSLTLYQKTTAILFTDEHKIRINPNESILIKNENNKLKIRINDKVLECSKTEIVCADKNNSLNYDNRNYTGILQLASDENNIQVINILALDDYLKGVIPAEMPLGNGTDYNEALKAFAICARTYALSRINKENNFDVYSDVRDQAYGGAAQENDLINKIINDTKDMILTYDDKPAIIYYSSTCGGRTEDAQNVFTDEQIPYLISIKDGEPPNCSISPRFNWQVKFSKEDFINYLMDAELIKNENVSLKGIKIKSRFPSGRINELQITFNENGIENHVSLYGNNIRSIIKNSNNGILYSNNFTVSINRDEIILNGKGFGHGVGLCQWGAIAQSKRGVNYKKILNFYFPGTRVEKIND